MIKINARIIKFFDTLADDTRLQMLVAISRGPATVSQIHEAMDKKITMSAISHQLKTMSDLDIVRHERKGRQKYFRLSDAYCWCPLRDALSQISKKTRCEHCAQIMKRGDKLI